MFTFFTKNCNLFSTALNNSLENFQEATYHFAEMLPQASFFSEPELHVSFAKKAVPWCIATHFSWKKSIIADETSVI